MTIEKGYVESYKICVGHTPHRRETEPGALALAERYQKRGYHGTIEAVVWDGGKVVFELIKKF